MKKFILLLAALFIFSGVFSVYALANSDNAKDLSVADFRFDINKLSEVAMIIEAGKNNDSSTAAFGADTAPITFSDINPYLKKALTKIADINNDNEFSVDELSSLGIRKLNPDLYQRELKAGQYGSISSDGNLNHFLVMTKGKHAGTVLYNGNLKFIDSKNRQYFGLEIYNN